MNLHEREHQLNIEMTKMYESIDLIRIWIHKRPKTSKRFLFFKQTWDIDIKYHFVLVKHIL